MFIKKIVLTVIALAGLSACEEPLTPPEVTDQFWQAVKARDNTRLSGLISQSSDGKPVQVDELPEIESWKTGKIIIDENRSEVETQISIAGEKPFQVTVNTYLIDENGYWKIDYPATVEQVKENSEIGLALSRLDDISQKMIEGLDQSIEQFQEAVPVIEQELSKIEEQLREKVPEIRKRLDEFARKLEEALKNKRPPDQEQPVEI